MEGFVQKAEKAASNYCTIKESKEINLAEHFGKFKNARLNPKSLKLDNSNPPTSNTPTLNPPINEEKLNLWRVWIIKIIKTVLKIFIILFKNFTNHNSSLSQQPLNYIFQVHL